MSTVTHIKGRGERVDKYIGVHNRRERGESCGALKRRGERDPRAVEPWPALPAKHLFIF